MKALEGVTISGQVAPDSIDGKLIRIVHDATRHWKQRPLQYESSIPCNIYQLKTALNSTKLSLVRGGGGELVWEQALNSMCYRCELGKTFEENSVAKFCGDFSLCLEFSFLKWSRKLAAHFCTTLTCSAGVSLGRANTTSSRSFIRPAMFDLELEWTVGAGGGGRATRLGNLHSSTPTPLLTLDRSLSTNFFLSPAFRCH